jgi:hypothetical protein
LYLFPRHDGQDGDACDDTEGILVEIDSPSLFLTAIEEFVVSNEEPIFFSVFFDPIAQKDIISDYRSHVAVV